MLYIYIHLHIGLPQNEWPELSYGDDGIVAVATFPAADTVVTGIVGCAGLLPTIAAIKSGKDIALANKETLIAGGPIVVPLLEKHGVKMLPADSEHSAIFQTLQGVPPGALKKIILTASGGAFRDWPKEKLAEVKVADALKHPNWAMGAKITVDSATMMNKGLEVIEAHYLFGADYDDIEIAVHPQSIVHSGVELQDTSVILQAGEHVHSCVLRMQHIYTLHTYMRTINHAFAMYMYLSFMLENFDENKCFYLLTKLSFLYLKDYPICDYLCCTLLRGRLVYQCLGSRYL